VRLGCLRDFVDCLCCTGNSSHISHGQLSVSNNTRCRTHAGLSGPLRRCGRQKGSGALSAAEVAADLVGQLGVLELRTGKLRPADPADLITHQAPVDYDPDAKCPLWLRTLEDSITMDQVGKRAHAALGRANADSYAKEDAQVEQYLIDELRGK
jgi:hypothetical protein